MNDDPTGQGGEGRNDSARRHSLPTPALPAPRSCREALSQIHRAWLHAGRDAAAGGATLRLRDALAREAAGGGPDSASAVLQTLIDTIDHCLADQTPQSIRAAIRQSGTSGLIEAILGAVVSARPSLRFAEPTFLARLDALVAAGRREVDAWRNGR